MVDNLNADVAKLRANEQLLAGSSSTNKEILAGQSEIRVKLDEEFKRQSEQYAQQVKHLRDELESKEKNSEELKEYESISFFKFMNTYFIYSCFFIIGRQQKKIFYFKMV